MPPVSKVMPLPTRPSTGVCGAPGGSWRNTISRGGSLLPRATPSSRPIPSFAICVSSRISTLTPASLAMRRRAPRELARRQRVARLVRELARQVAALAEDPAARHRRVDDRLDARRRVDGGDGPRRRRRRRRVVRLVAAAVELGERQPLGDRLRQIGGVALAAHDERRARHVPLTRGQPAAVASLRSRSVPRSPPPAADERDPPRPPARIRDRREEELVRLALKLRRRQRARQLAAGRRVEARQRVGALALEPRHDQQVGCRWRTSGPLVQVIDVDDGAGDIRLLSLMTLAARQPRAVQFAHSSCRGEDRRSWSTCGDQRGRARRLC